MRVFVYEFFSGGGLWHCPGAPAASLLAEGHAMLAAVAADFASLPAVETIITRDVRRHGPVSGRCASVDICSPDEESEAVARLASAADWTLLIAPETDGRLLSRSRLVEARGGRLLSPSSACIEIATSKQATAELLSRCGVPVPRGMLHTPGAKALSAEFSLPAIIKPVDGCGSQGVRLVRDLIEVGHETTKGEFRLEEFVPGQAASVAVLCGPAGNHALPACEQRLSADGRFSYLGGRLPLNAEQNARARRLALATASALPQPRGYIGVDLILGDAADGSGDRVIEINPRLTTSYIGLRAASRTNLAAAMLAVVAGRPPDLCFSGAKVEFTAEGAIL